MSKDIWGYLGVATSNIGGARKKRISLLLTLIVSCPAFAAPDATTKQEVSQLIAGLAASGCRFNRNGSWYDASRAASHLNSKYEYFSKKDLLPNTEAFIERAASSSSASGKPYLVKCAALPEVPSAAWFREALAKLREKSRNLQEQR